MRFSLLRKLGLLKILYLWCQWGPDCWFQQAQNWLGKDFLKLSSVTLQNCIREHSSQSLTPGIWGCHLYNAGRRVSWKRAINIVKWVLSEKFCCFFFLIKNLTVVFLSSFTMLIWTVWHHQCNRLVSVLPICCLKTELIFTLLVAFYRLSSLPHVGLTSRSWMCWMKIAGDWLSLILPASAAFIFVLLLVECGLCLQNDEMKLFAFAFLCIHYS